MRWHALAPSDRHVLCSHPPPVRLSVRSTHALPSHAVARLRRAVPCCAGAAARHPRAGLGRRARGLQRQASAATVLFERWRPPSLQMQTLLHARAAWLETSRCMWFARRNALHCATGSLLSFASTSTSSPTRPAWRRQRAAAKSRGSRSRRSRRVCSRRRTCSRRRRRGGARSRVRWTLRPCGGRPPSLLESTTSATSARWGEAAFCLFVFFAVCFMRYLSSSCWPLLFDFAAPAAAAPCVRADRSSAEVGVAQAPPASCPLLHPL